jgi:hypothetical protein
MVVFCEQVALEDERNWMSGKSDLLMCFSA